LGHELTPTGTAGLAPLYARLRELEREIPLALAEAQDLKARVEQLQQERSQPGTVAISERDAIGKGEVAIKHDDSLFVPYRGPFAGFLFRDGLSGAYKIRFYGGPFYCGHAWTITSWPTAYKGFWWPSDNHSELEYLDFSCQTKGWATEYVYFEASVWVDHDAAIGLYSSESLPSQAPGNNRVILGKITYDANNKPRSWTQMQHGSIYMLRWWLVTSCDARRKCKYVAHIGYRIGYSREGAGEGEFMKGAYLFSCRIPAGP
jgi:hypothetical protein